MMTRRLLLACCLVALVCINTAAGLGYAPMFRYTPDHIKICFEDQRAHADECLVGTAKRIEDQLDDPGKKCFRGREEKPIVAQCYGLLAGVHFARFLRDPSKVESEKNAFQYALLSVHAYFDAGLPWSRGALRIMGWIFSKPLAVASSPSEEDTKRLERMHQLAAYPGDRDLFSAIHFWQAPSDGNPAELAGFFIPYNDTCFVVYHNQLSDRDPCDGPPTGKFDTQQAFGLAGSTDYDFAAALNPTLPSFYRQLSKVQPQLKTGMHRVFSFGEGFAASQALLIGPWLIHELATPAHNPEAKISPLTLFKGLTPNNTVALTFGIPTVFDEDAENSFLTAGFKHLALQETWGKVSTDFPFAAEEADDPGPWEDNPVRHFLIQFFGEKKD